MVSVCICEKCDKIILRSSFLNRAPCHKATKYWCQFLLEFVLTVKYTVRHKNTPIFYHNWKKGYPILIIFGTHIHDTTGHQISIQFPTSPNICFCTTWKNRTDKICIKINKNLFKISFSKYLPANSQPITRFDCCAAARLLNRLNIREY